MCLCLLKNNTFTMKLLFTFLLVSCSILCSTCSKRPAGSPKENEVWIEYKLFNPSRLMVKVGTTVTFINKANANHTITNINGLFDSGKIISGKSFSYTFNTAGSYSFYCNYHSGEQAEQGYIIVEP